MFSPSFVVVSCLLGWFLTSWHKVPVENIVYTNISNETTAENRKYFGQKIIFDTYFLFKIVVFTYYSGIFLEKKYSENIESKAGLRTNYCLDISNIQCSTVFHNVNINVSYPAQSGQGTLYYLFQIHYSSFTKMTSFAQT